MSEFQGVETLSGHIDFGQAIGEIFDDVHLPLHERQLPESIKRGLKDEKKPDRVEVVRPSTAHFRTVVLDGVTPTEITLPYAHRANITVTCQAGGPVRLGADNQIGVGAQDAKSVALPTGASRSFTFTGKIFAHGPANAVIDVIEEHYA